MAIKTIDFLKNKFGLDLSQKVIKMLEIDRYKRFCGLLAELGFKVGAEIGTLDGMYAKWLCAKNRKLKLFAVDPYVSYPEYTENRTQDDMYGYEARAKERLAKFNVEFVKKFSMDAINDFLDNSLDFVYIDANHDYKFVKEDIDAWSKKVKKGGIVSGHDYSDYHFKGVVRAVDEHIAENEISPLFLIGNKTWFYVK